jgi:hypothetical protein
MRINHQGRRRRGARAGRVTTPAELTDALTEALASGEPHTKLLV